MGACSTSKTARPAGRGKTGQARRYDGSSIAAIIAHRVQKGSADDLLGAVGLAGDRRRNLRTQLVDQTRIDDPDSYARIGLSWHVRELEGLLFPERLHL
ncbi:hypothetical protein [Kribbella sp. VKM Ac-2568]|uniref:hypothetical protein n=1 Tax=Kribbella sp. VKM Ac-2568 TaxID=2512219 RepID=UPI0018EEBF43|nr:hypothetical protein [Kribbella sp. VKM Ac-2568]